MIRGIDYSHHQDNNYDYPTLISHGVKFGIPKATTGCGIVDHTCAEKLAGLNQYNLLAGTFHWLTPEEDGTAQALNYFQNVDESLVDFYAIDVEDREQWIPLGAIRDKKDRKKLIRAGKVKNGYVSVTVGGDTIASNFLKCLLKMRELTRKPVLLYTRTSFLKEYAPKIIPMIVEYNIPLWLAQYFPITPKVRYNYNLWTHRASCVKMDWDEFLGKYEPKSTSFIFNNRSYKLDLPDGVNLDLVKIWQWNGDSAHLSGMPGYTELDLYLGTFDELLEWLGQSSGATEEEKLMMQRQELAAKLFQIDMLLEKLRNG